MNEYLTVTEQGMKDALIQAHGDIFIASQLLHITALRFERAIRLSPLLRATLDSIPQPGAAELSTERINEEIQRRLSLYRVTGLDALAELATMPIDENSAQNQVKLAAAARLAGTTESGSGSGDVAQALRELNQLYHEQAPRLRVVRERLTVELQGGEQDVTPAMPAP